MTRWINEFIGTFVLVFFGTGAILGSLGAEPIAVAAVFGLAVMTMIYAIGDVSGAHINPAVTIAFWLAGRLPARDVPPYVVSQLLGALAASGLMRALHPEHPNLGATLPTVDHGAAFGLEVMLTFVLMFVIIHVAEGAKETGIMAGIAIGGTVAMEAAVAGEWTGASMNPARSLGPALVSGETSGLWIYTCAPVVGAALAIASCRFLRDECCEPGAC